MDEKKVVPYIDQDHEEPRLAEHGLWCAVIERLIFDLRASDIKRNRAIRDFWANTAHFREILEERCGFSVGAAQGFFEKITRLVIQAEAEIEAEDAYTFVRKNYWQRRAPIQ